MHSVSRMTNERMMLDGLLDVSQLVVSLRIRFVDSPSNWMLTGWYIDGIHWAIAIHLDGNTNPEVT